MRVVWVGILAGLAIGAMPGCRLLSREGLISGSLVRSRQFCQQGVAAMERDQWPESEALLAKAVKTCPEDPDAHRFLAESLWHQGRRQEAVEQLEEATRLSPDDSTLFVLLAERRLALGQTDRARRATRQALDLDPKLSAAWAMRARVTRADGRLRQSLSDYHRALGFAPDDRRVLMEIAELYHELNEPQKALATVHTLADTWPLGEEPQRVLLLEGLAYTKLGRYKEATESLAAANLVDQPTPEIFFRLAEAELLAGHPQRAFEAAEQALRLDPRHRPSLELLQRVDVAGKAGQGLTR